MEGIAWQSKLRIAVLQTNIVTCIVNDLKVAQLQGYEP